MLIASFLELIVGFLSLAGERTATFEARYGRTGESNYLKKVIDLVAIQRAMA